MRMGGFRGGTWRLDPDCVYAHGRIQRGDMGSGPPPLKNHKTIGFSSNTGMDLQKKNHKVTKPALNVGPSLVQQSLPSPTKKKTTKKTLPKSDPLWQNFLDPRKMCKLV